MDNSSHRSRKKSNISVFTEFIKKAESLPLEKRQNFVDKKFKSLKKKLIFPLIHNHDVVFVYKGIGNNVELMGDMTSWQLFPLHFRKLEGTDLFYLKSHYEGNARLDYKFSIDGHLLIDILNPKVSYGFYGGNSELIMPEYWEYSESNYIEDIPHGTIIEEMVKCEALKQGNKIEAERKISIYLPPGYDKAKKYKVLYFKDGSDYIKFGKAQNILNYMIHKGEIEPVLAVFVDPIDRDEDYVLGSKDIYVNFFVNELIPHIEENYSAENGSASRGLIGCSAGASIITYIAYKYPEKFRYLLCHSGYFSYAYEDEFGEAHGKKIYSVPYPMRVFMVIGSYDWDIISTNIWFYSDLKENPSVAAMEFRVYPQGHSWGLWKDTLREGLIWLLNEDKK